MTIRSEIAATQEQWRLLTFYEKFEQVVVLILTALIAIIVAAAVWNLALNILSALILHGAVRPQRTCSVSGALRNDLYGDHRAGVQTFASYRRRASA